MGWYIVYETPERLLDFTRREHREEGGKAEPYQTMSQDGVLSVDGMGGAETLVGISARTIPLAVTTSVPEVSAPHDAMGPSPARARRRRRRRRRILHQQLLPRRRAQPFQRRNTG